MSNAQFQYVTCCFCGVSVLEENAVLMNIFPPHHREESQALYADLVCLKERLQPTVPLHPGFWTKEDI